MIASCIHMPKLVIDEVLRHIITPYVSLILVYSFSSPLSFLPLHTMLVSCIEKNCSKQNYFSTLPLEIITNIFSFLSNIRDCGECMRVCHQWRDNMISLSADQPRALRLGNYQVYLIRESLLYLGYLIHNVEVHTSTIRLLDVIEGLAQLKLPRLRSLCKSESLPCCPLLT